MPMFLDSTPALPGAAFSPLKSNLEDMVLACSELENELAYFVDDGEVFGLLTEETFLENAPNVLKLLERISSIASNSTRDLTFEDEVFESDSESLVVVLYHFLSDHRRVLDTLVSQQKALKSTGSYYDTLGRCINSQNRALASFRNALNSRYHEVKIQSEDDWVGFSSTMAAAVDAFPIPPTSIIA